MKKKRIIVITAIAIAAVAAAVLYFFVFRKMDIKTSRFMVSKSEVYTGEAICPPVKVVRKDKITNRTHTLKERIDYKVEYRNNIDAGEAEVIVTGINRYRGGVKIPFTVAPAPPRMDSTAATAVFGVFGAAQIAHMPAFARRARFGITRTRPGFAPNAASKRL